VICASCSPYRTGPSVSDWFPPPSRPRPVDGGLKARSTRGAIAQTWWSQRFIGVLEGIGMGSRLQRGRSYARKGQVISMEVGPGLVTAQVQGSRTRPYRVRIGIGAFGKAEWAQVEGALAENAWYAAALLSGEMPEDIEDVFAGLGLSLFPATARELSLDCSCPDGAVPCKHLAATSYFIRQVDVPSPGPRVTLSTALLDQLPDVTVGVRGRPLVEILRPAYAALSEGGGDR